MTKTSPSKPFENDLVPSSELPEEQLDESIESKLLKSRKYPKKSNKWNPIYTTRYGVVPCEYDYRDPEVVLKAKCSLCEIFGREPDLSERRVRRRTMNSKYFGPTFRSDNIQNHMKSQHPKKWEEIQDLSLEEMHQLLQLGTKLKPLPTPPSDPDTTQHLPPANFEPTMTLEYLRKRAEEFADERDWNQFHTPRNLAFAMVGEVGELCECFQWKGEKHPSEWTLAEKEHLGEELSDVLIYLVRLADKCQVDLPTAVMNKMLKNERKYPKDLVAGSSKKYTEYNITDRS